MKLVILDRDGVINADRADFVKSPAEWQPIPGSLEAIVRLKQAGFRVVVASNQSGLASGTFDYEALFAIHDKMTRLLAELGTQLDGVFFCPHDDGDACRCRKPDTGLLEDISRRMGVSLHGSWMIGDRQTDVQAARAMGVSAIRVRSGADRDTDPRCGEPPAVFDHLSDAADSILLRSSNPNP